MRGLLFASPFTLHTRTHVQEYPWPWGDFVYYSRTVEGKVSQCSARSIDDRPILIDRSIPRHPTSAIHLLRLSHEPINQRTTSPTSTSAGARDRWTGPKR
jgi:hypothetical protein